MEFTGAIGAIIVLVLLLAVVICPFVIIYRPADAGPFGVLVLFLLAGYYVTEGKSAFTEITAAVFAVGAFLLAALVALARIAERAFSQATGQQLAPDHPPVSKGPDLITPDQPSAGGKWTTVKR